jgi:hypothetical protein
MTEILKREQRAQFNAAEVGATGQVHVVVAEERMDSCFNQGSDPQPAKDRAVDARIFR